MSQQVDFYLLGNVDQTGKLKYACRIAQKAFKQGLKVFVQTENSAQCQQLDTLLWTFSQGSFVPHTVVNEAPENWENFPVQLGKAAPLGDAAHLLISLTADPPNGHTQFKRIADLITDEPTEKQAGRNRFRYYRQHGIEPATHKIAPG